MSKESDPSIEAHKAEQKLGDELFRDALPFEQLDFEMGNAELEADDVTPEIGQTVCICATHTGGIWKIMGRWADEPASVPCHLLIQDKDPDVLRGFLRLRGYTLDSGMLWIEHHTGVEIWKRGAP